MADADQTSARFTEETCVPFKYTTFETNFIVSDNKNQEDISLQEAFRRYREAKQDELRQARLLRKRQELRKADPQKMAALRWKFVSQAKRYYGYPYARKYWPPDSPEYNSKLFLDCCGLVRKVMRDLSDDFGFIIGPWNQAYMFDTLPKVVESEKDMKPGDLVFISATYYNPKSKKQRHNMTHVEIWAGEGCKTIGARWNNGKVQLWDSYKFVAKSYHSETYHFRSIDTWLKGICSSHCAQHSWRRSKYTPTKKSIFALPEQIEEDEAADFDNSTDSQHVNSKTKERNEEGKLSAGTRASKLPVCSQNTNPTPTFYIGGGNGVSLVEGPLTALGWKRITDKNSDRFKLKWVELKSRINYINFKEGEQLVNHLPNSQLLTNKLGLLNSLKEYERVTLSTKGRLPRLHMADFHPETYKLDEKTDRDLFLDVYKENEIWICKPTGMNQGKGIFLIRNREAIDKILEGEQKKQKQPQRNPMSRIVQRYITNPLLLEGRKFDIRAYMLVASTTPFLILFHKGYVRLCCHKYDEHNTDLGRHLTNQYVQKKDPQYDKLKETTAWSMDKFNEYINEEVRPDCPVEIEEDWVNNTFTRQMQKIMIHCFNSVKHKLQSRIGYFDLFGLDFMVDTDMKIHLIEINTNPALTCNCKALKDVIPGVVEETLHVAIECFEKTKKGRSLMPLESLKKFTVLYCGSHPNNKPSRRASTVPKSRENSTTDRPKSQSEQQGQGHQQSGQHQGQSSKKDNKGSDRSRSIQEGAQYSQKQRTMLESVSAGKCRQAMKTDLTAKSDCETNLNSSKRKSVSHVTSGSERESTTDRNVKRSDLAVPEQTGELHGKKTEHTHSTDPQHSIEQSKTESTNNKLDKGNNPGGSAPGSKKGDRSKSAQQTDKNRQNNTEASGKTTIDVSVITTTSSLSQKAKQGRGN